MTGTERLQEHWRTIDPDRLERFEQMFQWNPASRNLYDSARIAEGHVVADFGCGPGHTAIEIARWVGQAGHVHALDINAEFIRRVGMHAAKQGLADRVSAHLLDGTALPLPDASLDRVLARNAIIYVSDPVATLREFHRVLRPGGIAHAIEGDWRLTAVQPVPTEEWREVIEAAAWSWPWPELGRGLAGFARHAGFGEIAVQVLTNPDTTGRLLGMIRTVLDAARTAGTLVPERIDAVLARVQAGLADGTYLAIVPQFVVTATKSDAAAPTPT